MSNTPEISTESEKLRFPIGRFARFAASVTDVPRSHIENLRLLPMRLNAAVDGLDDHQLDTPYREGGWTIRQVIHHVADSHANSYIRFKLALTEDWPTIKPYDEAAWAELADSRLPIKPSLNLLAALHERWVALLESFSEADYAKGYIHPASGGRQSLSQGLALYSWHSLHHTAHITSLRSRMAW